QCPTTGASASFSLDFLFSESGGLNSPDPVNIKFPFQSSQVTEFSQSSQVAESSQASQSSQLNQLELSESEVAPSKLQAKFQYYLQAVARRCSALSEVSDFMKNSIALQEDLFEDIEITQTTLGVYEIDIDEECPEDEPEEEEDPASLYVSGVNRFDEPTSAVEEPTKEINLGTEED